MEQVQFTDDLFNMFFQADYIKTTIKRQGIPIKTDFGLFQVNGKYLMLQYVEILGNHKYSKFYDLTHYIKTPEQDIYIDNILEYKTYMKNKKLARTNHPSSYKSEQKRLIIDFNVKLDSIWTQTYKFNRNELGVMKFVTNQQQMDPIRAGNHEQQEQNSSEIVLSIKHSDMIYSKLNEYLTIQVIFKIFQETDAIVLVQNKSLYDRYIMDFISKQTSQTSPIYYKSNVIDYSEIDVIMQIKPQVLILDDAQNMTPVQFKSLMNVLQSKCVKRVAVFGDKDREIMQFKGSDFRFFYNLNDLQNIHQFQFKSMENQYKYTMIDVSLIIELMTQVIHTSETKTYKDITIINETTLTDQNAVQFQNDTQIFTYSRQFDPIAKEIKKSINDIKIYNYNEYKFKYSEQNIVIMPQDKISANSLFCLLNNSKQSIILTKPTQNYKVEYRDNSLFLDSFMYFIDPVLVQKYQKNIIKNKIFSQINMKGKKTIRKSFLYGQLHVVFNVNQDVEGKYYVKPQDMENVQTLLRYTIASYVLKQKENKILHLMQENVDYMYTLQLFNIKLVDLIHQLKGYQVPQRHETDQEFINEYCV